MNAISSFKEAFGYLIKDKVSFVMALIPVVLGVTLYYFAGVSVFSSLKGMGAEQINKYLGDGSFGTIAVWILSAILTVLLFYIINITFVMILSIIASPFNDVISKRIEKKMLGEPLPSFSESVGSSFGNVVATIVTEVKKIVIVLGISLLAVVLGLFPLLLPISFLLSAVVLSTEFIDYSWSRHEMSFKDCKSEYKSNFLSYSFGGLFFMFLVAIPGLNIIVPSYGTSYFTVLWVKINERNRQIAQ